MADLQQIADIVGIALIRFRAVDISRFFQKFPCLSGASFQLQMYVTHFLLRVSLPNRSGMPRCQSPCQAVAARPSPGTSRGRPARKLQAGTVPAVLLGTAAHASAARKREEGRRARQATEANGGTVREGDGGRAVWVNWRVWPP